MAHTAGRRGSVRKDNRRGTWTVVVDTADVGSTARQQVRRRGFSTEREAQRALTSVVTELDQGTYVRPDLKTTLTEYIEQTWLPAIRVRQLRASTVESYRRNLAVHVQPRLGHRPLSLITTAELDRLYADLLAGAHRRALAPRSVRYIHTVLLGLYNHAVRKGHVAANPCSRADVPSPKSCRSREMSTWTAEQLGVFLRSLDGDAFRAPLFLLATTGMRRGEALGLQWDDLRLDEGQLDIRRTLGSVANNLVVGEPKTDKGRRTVSLDPPTVQVLREHRAEQLRTRLSMGGAFVEGGWVFCQPDGSPLHPTRFQRVFHRRALAAGLPKIRLHDLRHTWATLALRAGINPKIVQERIGHASVAITLDLYTHLDRAQHDAAARAVTSLFWFEPGNGSGLSRGGASG
jgi:integrase